MSDWPKKAWWNAISGILYAAKINENCIPVLMCLGHGDQVEALQAENANLREELAKRAKQLGVACMKHDLTHSLACGHCQKELRELVRKLIDFDHEVTEWQRGTLEQGEVIQALKDERDTLRELVREALEGPDTGIWNQWKERAEKALEST